MNIEKKESKVFLRNIQKSIGIIYLVVAGVIVYIETSIIPAVIELYTELGVMPNLFVSSSKIITLVLVSGIIGYAIFLLRSKPDLTLLTKLEKKYKNQTKINIFKLITKKQYLLVLLIHVVLVIYLALAVYLPMYSLANSI